MMIYERSFRGLAVTSVGTVVGTVHDVLFDDMTWEVRHIVVRTSRFWNRDVTIPVRSVALPDWQHGRLAIRLSSRQIQRCPDIDSNKPVSRQEEYRLHQYQASMLGLPYEGFGMALAVPTEAARRDLAESAETVLARCDPHLRSCAAVRRYRVQLGSGGPPVRADDFIINTDGWKITHLVLRLRGWSHTRRFLLPSDTVRAIHWDSHSMDARSAPQPEISAPRTPSRRAGKRRSPRHTRRARSTGGTGTARTR